jgi:hypothetical protein
MELSVGFSVFTFDLFKRNKTKKIIQFLNQSLITHQARSHI